MFVGSIVCCLPPGICDYNRVCSVWSAEIDIVVDRVRLLGRCRSGVDCCIAVNPEPVNPGVAIMNFLRENGLLLGSIFLIVAGIQGIFAGIIYAREEGELSGTTIALSFLAVVCIIAGILLLGQSQGWWVII